jgi:hypothetical protein
LGIGGAIGLPFVIGNNLSNDYEMDLYEINLLEISDVPVAEKFSELGVDTESGTVDIVLNVETLPLCLTDNNVNDYITLTAESYGGYEPTGGLMTVKQDKADWWGYQGLIDVDWKKTGCTPCGIIEWTATLDVVGVISLDSNHLPVVTGGDLEDGWRPSDPLDKMVDICVSTNWEGCPWPDQKFKIILAQKSFFRSPPTSMKISSPV